MSIDNVITHLSGRQVEIFYVLLVTCGRYTFLPELYDIFGRENTIKFLEIFAGCNLYVPGVDKLEKLAKNSEIYIRIEQVSEQQKPSVITTIAEEMDISEDRVRTVYVDTKISIEDLHGFKVTKKRKC